jgi:hypothetical protein
MKGLYFGILCLRVDRCYYEPTPIATNLDEVRLRDLEATWFRRWTRNFF